MTRLEGTGFDDLQVLDRPVRRDERGSFSRLFSSVDWSDAGLGVDIGQISHSRSERAGTLRGLHFQYPPFGEVKVVACISGAIWDVAVDLRPGSATYLRHFHTVLEGNDGRSLVVPIGFAHGFMTLAPQTDVVYVSSQGHVPSHEDGVRYDDDLLRVPWPSTPAAISEKDLGWAPLRERVAEVTGRFDGYL